jgi:hypothetical protein
MKKICLFIILTLALSTLGFTSCSNHSDILVDRYTQIEVNKDTFIFRATANNSYYVKATKGAIIKSIELTTGNQDTIIKNGSHIIANTAANVVNYEYNDTISAKWCEIIKTKDNPTIFNIYIKNNDTGQERKAILNLDGFLLVPKNVTIIQQAN